MVVLLLEALLLFVVLLLEALLLEALLFFVVLLLEALLLLAVVNFGGSVDDGCNAVIIIPL